MKNETEINIGSYKNATGEIMFNMTNDYMFRVVNQKNQNVPKGISCAVLHLDPETVQSAEIQNPIVLGNTIDEKTFVLDINVIDYPFVKGSVVFEVHVTKGVCDFFHSVLNRMSKVIKRIDAPLIACSVVVCA